MPYPPYRLSPYDAYPYAIPPSTLGPSLPRHASDASYKPGLRALLRALEREEKEDEERKKEAEVKQEEKRQVKKEEKEEKRERVPEYYPAFINPFSYVPYGCPPECVHSIPFDGYRTGHGNCGHRRNGSWERLRE